MGKKKWERWREEERESEKGKKIIETEGERERMINREK